LSAKEVNMLMKSKTNKENSNQITFKKGPSLDGKEVLKGREFGTELTNATEYSSECETDERSPDLCKESSYESNIPKKSPKTHKLSDHYEGTSISKR
jgi:hypothetical protein